MSEVGLLAELGPQTCSYYSSHRSRRSRFSVLNSSCRAVTELTVTEIDWESSGAFVCRIESAELGLLPELGPRNY
eukprot:3942415-Pyramimonas_sp.AAC.1